MVYHGYLKALEAKHNKKLCTAWIQSVFNFFGLTLELF